MITELNTILRVLPYQITPHFIDKIKLMDKSVSTDIDLRTHSNHLQKQVLEQCKELSDSREFSDMEWASTRDLEVLTDRTVGETLSTETELHIRAILQGFDIEITCGGLKSESSIERKIERHEVEDRRFVFDYIRFRVVAPSLRDVEAIGKVLRNNSLPHIVRFRNHYTRPADGLGEHYRALSYTFSTNHDYSVEIQILTLNNHIKSFLTHPFVVAKNREFPTPASKQWFINFLWKVNIVDFRKFLAIEG
ncbi:RelA/SpoT domain-containing protein [Anaerolineales bacterium HSG6]|nr:RelA/SpoT domain-containing protein [Anaerolineales bacterium HSG6]